MKLTKLLLLALCGLLCIGIFSCASSGGGGGGGGGTPGEVFAGDWEWKEASDADEGGNSTARLVVAEETIDGATVKTYSWSGEVNGQAEWPWVSLYVTPTDDATLAKLQSAKAVTFKIQAVQLPSGPIYMQAPTPAVTDYGFHRRNMNLNAGEVTEITLEFRTFTQPGWAAMKVLRVTNITELQFGVASANARQGMGSYSYKIWDFKLIM